jgi:hypothetical protein
MSRRPDLRKELLRRADRDQQARRNVGDAPTSQEWDAVEAVDRENCAWLQDVVNECGWPGIDLVGPEGAHAAWLIAQHAPLDLQRRWLPLLADAVKHRDAAAVNLAYLQDRVRCREHQPQRYGTQWRAQDGQQRLQPLEDPDEVNNLRAALDMPLLSADDIANARPREKAR